MGRHARSNSFAQVDEVQASGKLASVIQQHNVFLGGSSIGKGLKKAARYYLNGHSVVDGNNKNEFLSLAGAAHLTDAARELPPEEAFYVVDLGIVVSQVYQCKYHYFWMRCYSYFHFLVDHKNAWFEVNSDLTTPRNSSTFDNLLVGRKAFPRVEPFYAVKCNPDPVIVKTLAILGVNFDCASRNEIKLVQEASKDLPHKPDIIYANPCKARSHISYAVGSGVTMCTFDNATELQKIASISTSMQCILRIITDDRGSRCRFSSKFGAPRNKWRPLLAAAKQYGLKVIGVSFHVGSGCRDASRYEAALMDAKEIFEIGEQEFGMPMNIIDIGGGFPGMYIG